MADAKIRFVWHELLTTDTKAGGGFFSKVAGWKTEVAPNMPEYTLFKAGRPTGGGHDGPAARCGGDAHAAELAELRRHVERRRHVAQG